MKLASISLLALLALLILLPNPAHATQENRPLATDSRIRTYVYDPNEIFVFTGHYRFQTSIEFSPTEEIKTVSMGDSTAWQIVTQSNRIFLKPIDQDATTNMTVVTSERIYHFELYAEEAEDIRDRNLVFAVRFTYPNTEDGPGSSYQEFFHQDMPDIEYQPEKYNFNYTVSGSRLISPLKIFDDGEFTYMEFADINGTVPAIYEVSTKGNEVLVNFRILGPYVVVERVSARFTLRDGEDVACIFNEARL